MQEISTEAIEDFLAGTNPQQYIVAVEATYNTPTVTLVVNDPVSGKRLEEHKFKPFLWFKQQVTEILYDGKRMKIVEASKRYGVTIKALQTKNAKGYVPDRMDRGYKFLATCDKSYNNLVGFFAEGGIDVFKKDFSSMFVMFSPAEQFLMQSGKRLFKGMDDYDDLDRFQFDLETEGLNASVHRIFQIGMRNNKGFEEILETTGNTESQKRYCEIENIKKFFKVIDILQPDIITGYNSEFFDWDFFEKRCQRLGEPMSDLAITLSAASKIKRKDGMIKLGGVSEPYKQTSMYGYNIIDIAHSVRRAQAINSDIQKWSLKYITQYSKIAKPNRVYLPGDKLHTLWSDKKNKYAFNNVNGDWYQMSEKTPIKEGYEAVMGDYLVQRYLKDDLWETEMVDGIFNQATFLIAKILPTTFQRSSTMGTAGQWKLIMAAWSYQNKLAIPATEPKRDFTGGLSRLLEVGYARNVVKLDYAALYPKIDLTHGVFPDLDITGVMNFLLSYVVDTRDKFKFLTDKHKKIVKKLETQLKENKDNLTSAEIDTLKVDIAENKALQNKYDKKQLPLKILANSWFGSYGAPNIFNWGDTDCAEETTCRGRQYLRLMVRHFSAKYHFRPLVGDTDGFNFSFPDNIDDVTYVAKGSHWKTTQDAGKELTGLDAVLAEFNEEYMTGRMGLDIDDICDSTINFSRKNYANLIGPKVKLVGNSIKSKKMPTYIEEFLQKGIRMLLDGKGKDFIEYYYEYVDKIYNFNIPLVKIASKGKVNTSMKEYKKKAFMKNKAGNPMPKQAHMELALLAGIDVNHGDMIYYVNIGKVKSHGDLKSIKNKDTGVVQVELNCKMIDNSVVDSDYELIKELEMLKKQITEEELTGELLADVEDRIADIERGLATDEYNVARYLSAFNKKVSPLLVCFDPAIRNNILIEIKKDKETKNDKLQARSVFTELECKLSSGKANKVGDQDSYEDLMIMDDKEIKFWDKVNKVPNNMEVEEWVKVRTEYVERLEREKIDGVEYEKIKMLDVIKHMELRDVNLVRDEGILPIDIFKFSDLDMEGAPWLVSRKWDTRLCHIQELFKYEEQAIERDNYYHSVGIMDDIQKYELWMDYKAEQLILTGQTGTQEVLSADSLDNLTELIKEKSKTLVTVISPVINTKVGGDEDEDEETDEDEDDKNVFETEDDFALELQHNAYVDDVPVHISTRPNIPVYPIHKPIVKKEVPLDDTVNDVVNDVVSDAVSDAVSDGVSDGVNEETSEGITEGVTEGNEEDEWNF